MALVPTSRLGLNTWTAGTDPFTRPQRNADAATLDTLVAIYGQGTFAARPAAGTRGRFYLVDDATDPAHDGRLYYDTATAWRIVNPDPDLSAYATTAALVAGLAGKLGATAKAADSDLLDGHDSTYFAVDATVTAALAGKLGVAAKAADSDKLDGIDSTGFLLVGAKAADSDKLDGIDSTGFALVNVDVNSPRRYGRAFLLMGA